VKLENFNLSHVPVYIMSEDQLSMYAVYISTLGNRPNLFSDSEYVPKRQNGYTDYDIPPEAMEDEVFAAMITEAEKYLGYPYVWGGSNPSTSFDCSGFVSWVINHSGWNVGRMGAQGLCNICTLVSGANVRPGDLVFFEGTYDTDGVSHVGIYVGNNMMIHCGDPISYTNLNSSYWQTHFYAYGRLP
jgi:cell wall-associated NlpC family hydrolase